MNVRVYRNLHKQCWSIVDARTNRVIDHARYVVIKDPVFRVREAGRQRVLKERRKNVHAFVCGELVDSLPYDTLLDLPASDEVTYNPYQSGSFTKRTTGEPVTKAKWAFLEDKTVSAYGAVNVPLKR